LACKLIDKLAESSEVYEDEETEVSKVRRGRYVY
jgi:hypothetical protein